jgi:hypothetical protein
LTGPITSVGNATSIASQTGTGTKFVVDTSPTILTPTIASFANANHTHAAAGATGGKVDHGNLDGLGDDDHTQYTKKATLTEQGDLYYASAASTPAALAHGNANDYLISGGHAANPSWLANDGWIPAGETWTYASASDPEFTFTVTGNVTAKYEAGMRVKLTQSASVRYFIITKVAEAGGNTTITIYGGTDYDLANAVISANFYSYAKKPLGFPISPAKWTVTATDTSDRSQVPAAATTWYNLTGASINIPLGVWHVRYSVAARVARTGTAAEVRATLSDATNTELPNGYWTAVLRRYHNDSLAMDTTATLARCGTLDLSAADTYYLNLYSAHAADGLYSDNSARHEMVIEAVCAYL